MQHFESENGEGAAVLFTPSYLDRPTGPSALPHRVLPVLELLVERCTRVTFLDEMIDDGAVDRLAACVSASTPVVIWLAETNPKKQIHGLRRAVRRVETTGERPVIVAGGGFLQKWPGTHLCGFPGLDAVVRGHGGALAEVLDRVHAGQTLEGAPGLLFPAGDGFTEDDGKAVEDDARLGTGLGILPRLELRAYVEEGGTFNNGVPTLVLPAGRGCAHHCPHCWWYGQERSRVPAAELVDAVQQVVERLGVRQIHVADLDFLDDNAAALAFAKELISRDAGVRWGTNASTQDVGALDDESLDLLALSGLSMLELGAESASKRTLAWIEKEHEPGDSRSAAQRLSARGIVNLHDFLFGVPGETAEDVEQTLDLLLEMFESSPLVYVVPRLLEAQAGTPRGNELHALHEGLPRTVDELMCHRRRYRWHRTMPWLPDEVERWAKDLVLRDLPLALYGAPKAGIASRFLGSWARDRARRRMRSRGPAPAWERSLVELTLGPRLVRAYDA